MGVTTVVVIAIGIAIAFDIVNGFHDAANSIATIVSTRVLSPRIAVLWAAFFNFVALFVFHTGVANTIAKIVDISATDPAFVWVVLAGLIGAITWNLLTWWWGLPSSSSHALIGGIVGAAVTYGGWNLIVKEKFYKTIEFILIAPLMGFVLGVFMMVSVSWIFRRWRPAAVDRTFRIGQLISAAAYSIGHGGNDAQKTMGIIAAIMVAAGLLPKDFKDVPMWVIFASYGAMAVGTAFGGWRIVKTMGMGLTHLKPVGGFCAEVAGAATLFYATSAQIPVSTTHTITGAIVGVGSANKVRGVRWGLATRIVYAWIFTIPAAASIGALMVLLFHAAGAF
ncbi:MAG: inorganic phosphate transporter [Deltaproteobacteria bacterium]|nr:inorganic phosphate transporter [Deltaproteobacteria bacterium]